MQSIQKKGWLPAMAMMAGMLVSPLFAQDTSKETAKSKQTQTQQTEKKVIVANGEIVIRNSDGNVEVMKLKKDGDKTFVWKQESGEKTEGTAKAGLFRAILVGPNGKQEVELHLDGGEGGFQFAEGEHGHLLKLLPGAVDPEHIMVEMNARVGGFMLGVSCDQVSDALKKQLGIESGLVVDSVVPESPADGKLEQHDILIHAGDVNLKEIGQLIEAVQAAGEGEKELSLTLLRSGKKMNVALTPRKREMPEGLDIESLSEEGFIFKMHPEMTNSNSFDFETVGPGVIEWRTERGSESSDDLKAEIESLRKKLEELSGKIEGKK